MHIPYQTYAQNLVISINHLRFNMSDFKSLLKSHAKLVETKLEGVLASTKLASEVKRPENLMKAMRHSSLDGGKRLRPFLVMESAALFDLTIDQSVMAGIALECIHCYSLVHDDLPAMDDDDLRRGKPTTHIAFDEATAILAGDALLTLAFDILSRNETHPDAAIRIELVNLYARNAGLGGMVGGQIFDLEAETKAEISEQEIIILQSMKTGALIKCACETGAILANATDQERAALTDYGTHIGKAFQLADDILDVTSDVETMGKKTGKDADRGKGTLVDIYGMDKAKKMLNGFMQDAIEALQPFGSKADILRETARFTAERKY